MALLIHGVGMSGFYFGPLAQALAGEFHVVACDLPGFGRSAKPKEVWSVASHAELLASFLRQRQVKTVLVVGHSMGCQVILELGRLIPEVALKAVLIAPTVNKHERRAGIQLLRLLQDGFREPLGLKLVLLAAYVQCGIRTYLGTVPSMFAQDLAGLARGWRRPAVVIGGSGDVVVPSGWAREVAELLPQGRFVQVPGAHGVHHTNWARVAAVCRAFIAEQ